MVRKIVVIFLVIVAFVCFCLFLFFLITGNLPNVTRSLEGLFSSLGVMIASKIIPFKALFTNGNNMLNALLGTEKTDAQNVQQTVDDTGAASRALRRAATNFRESADGSKQRKIGELENSCIGFLKNSFRDPPSIPAIPGFSPSVKDDFVPLHFSRYNDSHFLALRDARDPEYLIRREQRRLEYIVKKKFCQLGERSLIIGPPGSGKTFYLKRLEWEVLQGSISEIELMTAKYPIYIDLNDFTCSPYFRNANRRDQGNKESPLIKYVVEQWHEAQGFKKYSTEILYEFLVRILNQEKSVIFLLDGLDQDDENGSFNKLVRVIGLLGKMYREILIIVTSHRGVELEHLESSSGLQDFLQIKVEDFCLSDIDAFINSCSHKMLNKKNELKRLLEKNTHLQAIAAKPANIANICKSYMDNGNRLLQKRSALYENCIKGLVLENSHHPENLIFKFKRSLKQIIFNRKRIKFKAEQAQYLLAHIAWHMHKDRQIEIKQQYFENATIELLKIKKNKSKRVEFEIQKAATSFESKLISQDILRKRKRPYSLCFSNIVLQEYLATWFASRFDEKTLLEQLRENACDPWWHEIIHLYFAQYSTKGQSKLTKSSSTQSRNSERRLKECLSTLRTIIDWDKRPTEKDDVWERTILMASCFALLQGGEEEITNEEMNNQKEEIAIRLYEIIGDPSLSTLFWRERAGMALAELGEHELICSVWERRRGQGNCMDYWLLDRGASYSPVLLPFLQAVPAINRGGGVVPLDDEIKNKHRRMLQDLSRLDGDNLRDVLRNTFTYDGLAFDLSVYERLHILIAKYIWASHDEDEKRAQTLIADLLPMLSDHSISEDVCAGIAYVVGLLGDEQTISDLIRVWSGIVSDFLHWQVTGALGMLHHRLGVRDGLYLPGEFASKIGDTTVGNHRVLYTAICLVSTMFHLPVYPHITYDMKFELNGRFAGVGGFGGRCIQMLADARDTPERGFDRAVEALMSDLHNIGLTPGDVPYLLDLLGHLAERPDQLNFFTGMPLDDNLKSKKSSVEWRVKRRSKALQFP